MVSFGGAYTTLPFIYTDAVTVGGWLSTQQFMSALAITSVMPTPLVSYVSYVGYVGGGVWGAVAMIVGMFLPAFSFHLIGHKYFEAIVDNDFFLPFLDGMFSAIIGLLAVTAFQVMKEVVQSGFDAGIFILAFYSIFHFNHKYIHVIAIIVAAIAGQVIHIS